MDFYTFRLGIANFLNTPIIDKSWIFLNLWSILHFISGFVLMYLMLKSNLKLAKKIRKYRNPYLFLFIFLVAYELFEFAFYSRSQLIFRTEPTIDWVWDLIIGMLGGFAYKHTKLKL